MFLSVAPDRIQLVGFQRDELRVAADRFNRDFGRFLLFRAASADEDSVYWPTDFRWLLGVGITPHIVPVPVYLKRPAYHAMGLTQNGIGWGVSSDPWVQWYGF